MERMARGKNLKKKTAPPIDNFIWVYLVNISAGRLLVQKLPLLLLFLNLAWLTGLLTLLNHLPSEISALVFY